MPIAPSCIRAILGIACAAGFPDACRISVPHDGDIGHVEIDRRSGFERQSGYFFCV
ncbi:hypothetical protein [Burkholderia territorii]|uniref:hypothetical protein n=1 Tax=Burkholderia territorii TaxID=1503055 RepID=UPI000ACE4E14|nr:hypothetical protein [Burkholderia territorii]